MSEKLPFHEWLIISLIVCIMLGLTIVTSVWDDSISPLTNSSHSLVSHEIKVTIKGSVAKPGSYTLKKRSTLKDLLLLAEPLVDANLSKFKVSSFLKNNQQINVPSLTMITIYLEGAVAQSGSLQVPKGTQIQELESYTDFLPDSDLKVLKKKRRLKDEELIYIPSKKSF